MSLLGPQLDAFIAITKHKTVHGAAAAIHLTQTAVTQRIRALEHMLGTTLFIRTRKGMLLTKEGEALLHYCQASQSLSNATLAKIKGAGIENEIELTISAPTSIMHARVIPACLPIMRRFPNLLIRFDVDDANTHPQALRAAQVDFAIIQALQVTDEMAHKKLLPEHYVLVCSTEWKNRKLTDIIKNERIIDFDPSDQVTHNYLKQYNLLDIAKHSRYFVNRTDNLAMLVAQGIGYSTLAKEFAEPYIKNKQLMILNKGHAYDMQPVLAWHARHEPPAYFSAIIDAIK
jgi:DNA-binding transcriptional LysR family regulator